MESRLLCTCTPTVYSNTLSLAIIIFERHFHIVKPLHFLNFKKVVVFFLFAQALLVLESFLVSILKRDAKFIPKVAVGAL